MKTIFSPELIFLLDPGLRAFGDSVGYNGNSHYVVIKLSFMVIGLFDRSFVNKLAVGKKQLAKPKATDGRCHLMVIKLFDGSLRFEGLKVNKSYGW
jgi:hypothetical protein